MRDCVPVIEFVLLLTLIPGNRQILASDPQATTHQLGGPELVAIKPGTLVENRPPKSWSHLVIKSLPRLASGDLQTLPRSAFRTAMLIRTIILADVGRSTDHPAAFALRRVGIGLCIPNQAGRDVVVDSGRLEEAGVSLSVVEKMVLKSAEAVLSRGRLIAATPTFALYHGPAVLQGAQAHYEVELYYALLVDEKCGSMRTFVWAQGTQAAKRMTSTVLVELEPNLVFDCPVNVEAQRLLGTLPVSWSFAMESLPPGQARPMTPELRRSLAGGPQSRDLEKLEFALRRALTEHPVHVDRGSAGF
jgi:hypothetical protein